MIPASDIDRLLRNILSYEGGYVDHQDDHGGPTNRGITLATLAEWRGKACTAADVEALTETETRQIYEARYIAPFSAIWDMTGDAGGVLVDSAVISGVGRAVKYLQAAIGANPDGVMGPETRRKLSEYRGDLRIGIIKARLVHTGRIITNDPKQAAFAAGWCRRIAEQI